MTIYLEITESRYNGTKFRTISKSYVPIEVEDLSKDNLESVIKKYCSDNDILFGTIYDERMIGTNPLDIHYFSTGIVVPSRSYNFKAYEYLIMMALGNYTVFDTTVFHGKLLEKKEDQGNISFDWYSKTDCL